MQVEQGDWQAEQIDVYDVKLLERFGNVPFEQLDKQVLEDISRKGVELD